MNIAIFCSFNASSAQNDALAIFWCKSLHLLHLMIQFIAAFEATRSKVELSGHLHVFVLLLSAVVRINLTFTSGNVNRLLQLLLEYQIALAQPPTERN